MAGEANEELAARRVAELVRAEGGRALLVGGCVRDSLLGERPKDLDLECFGVAPDGLRRALEKEFELDAVGESFGILKLKRLDVDVAVPRRETKLGLGHRAFEMECDPALTVEEASARRDFTINAIYRDPLTDEILDPWNGRADLERRILRHVSPHFTEDPLRVLRGMQFVARFDLTPAPETIEICRGMTPEGLPRERLFGEWEKLLVRGRAVARGLRFLNETGWTRFFPELDPDETEDAGEAVERLGPPEARAEDPALAFAAFCRMALAFGKGAADFMGSLTSDARLLAETAAIEKAADAIIAKTFSDWTGWTDAEVRRLSTEGPIRRAAKLADAALPGADAGLEALRKAEALGVADGPPKPAVMGRDLLARGWRPGPGVGKALAEAWEAQLDGEFSDLAGWERWLVRKGKGDAMKREVGE